MEVGLGTEASAHASSIALFGLVGSKALRSRDNFRKDPTDKLESENTQAYRFRY